MSIFGDETITPPTSPEDGQEEQGAGDLEDQTVDLDDQDDQDHDGQDEQNTETDELTEEPGDGSEGEDQGQPEELIAGKFKSQDDLLNAYLNLQREFTKEKQQKTGQQPPAQETGQQVNMSPEQKENFFRLFEEDPLGTLQYLIDNGVTQRTAPILEQRTNETIIKNYDNVSKEYGQMQTEDGMKQVMSRVQEIAQELGNPKLASQPTERVLRMAAQELYGDTKAKAYQKGKEAARQEAQATRQAKQGLGLPAGAKPKDTGQVKSEEDQIADDILFAGNGRRLFG